MGLVKGRYHFQTWGGTRPRGELRLTCLTPVYNASRGGDLIIFQRRNDSLETYRVLLLRQETPAYRRLIKVIGEERYHSKKCWGSLFRNKPALAQSDLAAAHDEIITVSQEPFIAIKNIVRRRLLSRNAIARDVAFRSMLLEQYGGKCAVSGIALATDLHVEVQAAHVVSLSQGGSDDLRNGFTLTGTLHWAFDNGLFCVEDNRKVYISSKTFSFHGNEWLRQFKGKIIAEAANPMFQTAPDAFAWHRENIFIK